MDKFLVIGLGNPGEKYQETRHNIGFKIADALCEKFENSFVKEQHGDLAKFKIRGRSIFLLKPSTFMNLSGLAVNYYLQKHKIKQQNLFIISDDLHLPFGTLKIKRNGSDGGHNGHRDIISKLNSGEYTRLKFGIGNNFKLGKQSNYVLSPWIEEEERALSKLIHTAVEIIISFCTLGVDRTMLDYN